MKHSTSTKWIVAQAGDNLQLKKMKGSDILADVNCNTRGKRCDGQVEGHSAKFSMWFNGPKLVMLETQGDKITRRRFQVGANGNTLKVEVTPISSGAKGETVTYNRESAAAPAP